MQLLNYLFDQVQVMLRRLSQYVLMMVLMFINMELEVM